MLITIALFSAGIAMGLAGACMWAWGVKTGQFRDMEKTKEQLFWPDLAGEGAEMPAEMAEKPEKPQTPREEAE